ncbi:PREDICTED: uncharacterized protein LOC105123173 [Populus euphratica]|uniref:Uncharacterized protein LOC105123173 n=1 Tax=Populus euphratica TaxID=75702 RepID=A0AAJ6U0N9_POPEU|nr:PREDICTED: uncharacterized protein LOC105123173 [Populus euphratica]
MDTPFYRIHRNYPSSSPQIPVHHRTTPVLPKKVVSIPVRYIGSERSRSESAIKIQKVFRGFLVRKSMKKILATKRQVDEIEKRILMKETVELMRRDQKEKLKINEMLMSLLLKLDSVRGVDSGVRDCRKAVIKKAIALQETVDSIAAAAAAANGDDTDDSVVSAGEKGVDETGGGVEEDGSVANAADELQNGAAESEAVVSILADSREAREEFNGALENVDMASEGDRNVECDGEVPTLMSDYCDSVLGVDSGVGDCRGAVIKKAIALQETVDSMAAAAAAAANADDSVVSAGEKGVDETGGGVEEDGSVANAADELQNGAAESEAVVSVLADSREAREEFNGTVENVDMASEGERKVVCDGDVPTLMSDYCEPERVLEVVNETVELKEAENVETACQGEHRDLEKQVDKDGDCMGTSQMESQSDSSASLMEGDDDEEEHSGAVEIEKKGDEGEVKSNDESTRRRGKELLERMMEDNERMMGLMAELFERNEMQTRLLSSLSQRVEQLERAYICDQLRRRKKKRNAAGLLDCLESTPKKL